MSDLPTYDELPPAEHGGRSAWGLFGATDSLGMLHLQTPERIAAAARLVRRGALFSLNAPLDAFVPHYAPGRRAPQRRILHSPGSMVFDDVYDDFYPQVSSQWDAFAHFGYSPGVFYNGASEAEILTGQRNTIEHFSRRGIAGRMIVLDMPRLFERSGRPYALSEPMCFTVDDLEEARKQSHVAYEGGDILLVHTGFAAWFASLAEEERTSVITGRTVPGLAAGEDMCRYLWDARLSAVASDSVAVEALPIGGELPTDVLHRMLLGQFGMPLGELWWTKELVADCALDGRYEAFLTSAPMNAPGGIGSPANALALK